MHDLLIALAFIGMVIAPAIVAAKSDIGSRDEYWYDQIPPDNSIVPSKSAHKAN